MSKPHAPAVSGPQVNIPEGSRGALNASTPMDQRVPDRSELSGGPNVVHHPGRGRQYLPARYRKTRIVIDSKGNQRESTIIVENR